MNEWEFITRLSAWPAFCLFLLAWSLPRPDDRRAFVWTWRAGAIALVIHVVIAFVGYHAGSHARAFEHTRAVTQARTGWNSGAGLYLNEAMLLLWLADAAWLTLWPRRYWLRPRWLHQAIVGFFAFMMFNAGVVFAGGIAQPLGAIGFAGAAWRRFISSARVDRQQ